MIKKVNHIGLAVKDLNGALAFFEEIYGGRLVRRDRYEDQKFETAFVALGDARLELIASLAPGSMIADFIENRGEGIHHMSLEVDQFEQVLGDFKAKGLTVLGVVNTVEFKAAFIHPNGNFGILTEIIEPKGDYP